jgi:hypothetical protein
MHFAPLAALPALLALVAPPDLVAQEMPVREASAAPVTLRGRVFWSDGTPAYRVPVSARDAQTGENAIWREETEEERVPDRALDPLRGLPPERRADPARGLAFDDRSDIARRVHGFFGDLPSRWHVLTDLDGGFTLQIAPDRRVVIAASYGSSKATVEVESRDATRTLCLLLPCTPSVRGRLEDPAGNPVRGEVRLWNEGRVAGPAGAEHWSARQQDGVTPTTAFGTFDADVPLGRRVVLSGSAAGFASSSPCIVELTEAHANADVTLRLHPCAEIRGRIVDELGAPLAGAIVCADPEARTSESEGRVPWYEELYGGRRTTWAGADGAFALSGLSPLTTYALIHAPKADGLVRATRTGVAPGSDDVIFVVQRDDLRTGSVSGVVLRADGTPAPHFQVLLEGATGRWFRDPEGRFRFDDLPSGREFALLAGEPGSEMQLVGTCRIDRPAQEVELRLQVPGASPEVRIGH